MTQLSLTHGVLVFPGRDAEYSFSGVGVVNPVVSDPTPLWRFGHYDQIGKY